MSPADDDYLWDRSGEDAEIERLEGLLGGLAHDAPMRPLAPRRRSRRLVTGLAIGGAALAAAAVIALVVGRRSSSPVVAAGCGSGGPGFGFAVTGDGVRCGGEAASGGVLPVGAWLETAGGSEAAVQVADIGEIKLFGGSRLRAVATGPDQHRLELERGKLSARVSAPPRLFVVDTPHAAAVDLGCAYELEVDAQGRTRLWVTSGVVSLEGGGRAAYVPAGVEVMTVAGAPGTPVRRDAPDGLRAAVARWDGGDRSALPAVIAASEDCDTITLWNLLGRTAGDERRAVFERLDRLAIRPEWVLEEDVLSGNPDAIEKWRIDLDGSWTVGLSPSAAQCIGAPGEPGKGPVDPHEAPPLKQPPAAPPEQPPAPPPSTGSGETWSPPSLPAPSSTPDDAAPATWR